MTRRPTVEAGRAFEREIQKAYSERKLLRLPPGARVGRAVIGKARNKFGARRVTLDGHNFASQAEADRYSELKLLERAGEIDRLELQPRFPLTVASLRGGPPRDLGTFVADFRYVEPGRRDAVVVEDVKGFDVPVNRLRRQLAEVLYSIDVRIIRKGKR